MAMHGMSSKYGIPREHIMLWHLVGHSLSILHAPTVCINVNQELKKSVVVCLFAIRTAQKKLNDPWIYEKSWFLGAEHSVICTVLSYRK